METFVAWLIWWSLALIICIIIWTANVNRLRNEKTKLEIDLIEKCRNKINKKDLYINKLEKDKENLNNKILSLETTIENCKTKEKETAKELKKNVEVMKQAFENEIDAQQNTLDDLRVRLHKEQIDSNNKEYSRDTWRKKFETLETVVEWQGFWKEILKKYRKNWKKITLAHNKAKKWTKHN